VDRIGSFDAAQADSGKQPLYRTSGIGGQPAVDFDGSNDQLVYAAADPVSTAQSGHVFAVVLADSPGLTVWSSGSNLAQNRYIYGVFRAGNPLGTGDWIQIGQRNNDTADTVLSEATATVINVAYLTEWASDAADYHLRIDNALQSLAVTNGTDSGDWFGDTTSRAWFTFGCIKHAGLELSRFDGKIAMLLVVDGAISSGDRTALNSWVADKYGITLA
jgi:hypothetical protein